MLKMDFSGTFGSLVAILLFQKVIQLDAICKEDQSRICRLSISGTGNLDKQYHPNVGTCVPKRYSTFTHVCSVNDYSPSTAFCCCSTQTTTPAAAPTAEATGDETFGKTLCCRYFQAWNTFRCDEERDAVPSIAASSHLETMQVWTISLVLFAVVSAVILLLIGCLKKMMTNRKKGLSNKTREQLNNSDDYFPCDQRFPLQQKCCQQYFGRHQQLLCNKQQHSPLIPTAPSIEFEYSAFCLEAGTPTRQPFSNSDDSLSWLSNKTNDSPQDNPVAATFSESTRPSNITDGNSQQIVQQRSGNCLTVRNINELENCCEFVETNSNMLRNSTYVESSIQVNTEPPPSYDEVMGIKD